jgi:hypothetical protein
MAIENGEDQVKPKEVKGINTAEEPTSIKVKLPEYKPEYAYKEPKTEKEAFVSGLATGAFEVQSPTSIQQDTFLLDPKVASLYNPIDLAKAIPDPTERAAYIEDNGSKLVKLMDEDKFGFRSNDDLKDYLAIKEKKYNTEVKRFLDELDENQGFLKEAGNTITKLIGKTFTAVTGLVPFTYGLAKGLFTWDAQNVFNNGMFDAWETMDQAIDKQFAVYGGSDYYFDHTGKERNFFSRFVNHPMKSINNDIVPAVSFVAGAVGSEFLAGAVTASTFGAAAPILAANTARLAAQATNLFSKGYKVIRGLDALSDMQNMRKIAGLTDIYRKGIGTVTSMVRSAGYESSLIARDTYDRTLEKAKTLYKTDKVNKLKSQGYTDEDIAEALDDPNFIPKGMMDYLKQDAENASELAWFANIPLVGFSNMVQFSKAFTSGYKINQALRNLNPTNITGTVMKDGFHIAKADAVSKFRKGLAFTQAGLKPVVTEAFEEYAQGVIEQGFSDYFSAAHTTNAVQTTAGFIDAMTKAARNYAGSVEGQDSMTIGALMGLLGIRLPVKINPATGKLTRGWEAYGGIRQEIKDLKEVIEKDRGRAEAANKTMVNPVLKANFENMAKNVSIQADLDKAEAKKDVFEFKNKEYEQLHSFVSTRYKSGIADTIPQELDALDKLPLENFNEQFSIPGVLEFNEETKKAAIAKTRENVDNIVKAHKEVETAFNDSKFLVDLFRRDYKGLNDQLYLTDGIKDQMTFLYGSTKNLEKREKELEDTINNLAKGKVNTNVINEIIGKISTVGKDGKVEVLTTARELYKAQLNEWKSLDPTNYNLYKNTVTPLLQDLISIKNKKAQVATMYSTLFTKKGAKDFVELYAQLQISRNIKLAEELIKKKEEDVKKAKSSNAVQKAESDLESLTGDTTIVDDKVNQELGMSDQQLSELIGEVDPSASQTADLASLVGNLDSETIVNNLQDKPALFNLLLQKLEQNNIIIPGLTNIDQLDEVLLENPDALAQIASVFNEVFQDYVKNQPQKNVEFNYADPTDANQPAPTNTDADTGGLAGIYNTVTQQLKEQDIFQPGSNVSEYSVIPILHDKTIDPLTGTALRDPETGKYVVWRDSMGVPSDHPVNLQLVNSPEFLNNKELADNQIMATFKVANNEWNSLPRSADNIAIDVYYGETFIGRLPAWREGMPGHLLSLRQAVLEQEANSEVSGENIISEDTINQNFDSIITQIANSNVDIFFDKNNQFKNCK